MRPRRTVLCTAIACAISLATGAAANAQDQPASENATVERLKNAVEQRDAVIRDLLRRVEKLEKSERDRRVAIGKPVSPQAARSPAKPTILPLDRPDELERVVGGAIGPGDISGRSVQPSIAQAPAPSAPAANAPPAATPPAAGPGQFEVSPEAAEHALERALVQTGALLLPPWTLEVVPSLTYQYREISRPGAIALSSSGNVLVTEGVARTSTLQAATLGRVGLPWDFQVEVGIPPYTYRNLTTTTRVSGAALSSSSTDGSGFGDPSVNLIKQVLRESEWLPSLFLNGSWNANFGQTVHGIALGQGFHQFQVGATAVKRQDPLVFTAGLAYQTSLENNNITPGDQLIPNAAVNLAVSPETSLRFSQQVGFVRKAKLNGQYVPGSQQVTGVFVFDLLSILAPGLVVDFTAAIGETRDAPDLTLRLGFPIRLN
ncbi:MAG: transporter [Alphaproteobacteria bacterium]